MTTRKPFLDLNKNERPREKIAAKGAACLRDEELLALIIGSGRAGRDVMALSAEVLRVMDRCNGKLTLDDIRSIQGMGLAKAASVAAAFELARRRIRPEGVCVRCAEDVLPLVRHFADRKQEHFLCVSLNGAHEVIATRVVTIGLVNVSQVHPREVFAEPIVDRACAVIIAHNHPSGSLAPSAADMTVTKVLTAAGETLGISVLDHVIFSRSGYYSFKEQGEL